MSGLWLPPEKVPPGTKNFGFENSMVLSDGFVPKVFPTPLLRGETNLSIKPSSSVCFPLHPMGSLRLYDISRQIVEGLESLPLTETERALAPAEIWRAVLRAYVPGESLRAGSDRLVDVVPPGKKTNDETIAANQLSADRVRLFALHVVSRAIGEWEQEAK